MKGITKVSSSYYCANSGLNYYKDYKKKFYRLNCVSKMYKEFSSYFSITNLYLSFNSEQELLTAAYNFSNYYNFELNFVHSSTMYRYNNFNITNDLINNTWEAWIDDVKDIPFIKETKLTKKGMEILKTKNEMFLNLNSAKTRKEAISILEAKVNKLKSYKEL